MLELYLPYLIALALGMDVSSEGRPAEAVTNTTASAEVSVRAVERAVDPQVADGTYTSALEVRPILDVTRMQWAAVSEDGSRDLLYFTNLLAWRCGLWEIRYGLNGAPADSVLPMEPCHMNTASPGAMTDIETYPIYVVLPQGAVQTLRIEVTFDDGTEDFVEVERRQILLP